ncbi:hypothetical protein MNBD_ALPHA06-1725, partial [hydrothermal vent metagenome]
MQSMNEAESEQSSGNLGPALRRVFRVLVRPELAQYRPIMGLAIVLTLVAKGFSVISPVFFGNAVNGLANGADDLAIKSLILMLLVWSLSRFLAVAFPQLRDVFFAEVSQAAVRLTAVETFAHASSLSLQFHLTRRAGSLNRVIERGANAIDYLLRFLAFNIVPTIVELGLAAIVLAVRYGIRFAVVALLTVGAYTFFTLWVTEWRVKQRRAMNKADNELRAIAIDSLTNFETVKAFAAEEREAERFGDAFGVFTSYFVKIMRSLSLLNAGQEFIMGTGVFTV